MTVNITQNEISSNLLGSPVINRNQQVFNDIKESGDKKEQLKKVSEEFESIFMTKMMSLMDKTVDKEGGIFGSESQYTDTFKNYVFQELGRDLSKNKNSQIGFANTIYNQMSKYVN